MLRNDFFLMPIWILCLSGGLNLINAVLDPGNFLLVHVGLYRNYPETWTNIYKDSTQSYMYSTKTTQTLEIK